LWLGGFLFLLGLDKKNKKKGAGGGGDLVKKALTLV